MDGDNSLTLGNPHSLVTNAENQELTKLVTTKEIRRALWAMTEEKALRPNGSFLFFKRY